MKRAFRRRGSRLEVGLAPTEVEVLRAVPVLLEGGLGDAGDPAWARLRYIAHPHDSEAEERFESLTAGMLDEARAADRARLVATLGERSLSMGDAEAWARVIGEARLALAARLGIDESGWNPEPVGEEPVEMSVLRLLGFLQESLVLELMDDR